MVGVEPPEPLHGRPLSLQLVGSPPVPMKPNDTLAPTGTEPFQPRLVNVRWAPDAAISVSQKLPTVAPAGRSTSIFQDVMADAPEFVMVTSAW